MTDLFASYTNMRDRLPDQGSITWVGVTETEIPVQSLGNPAEEISGVTVDDVCAAAMDLSDDEAIILVSQRGKWTVLFEPAPFCGFDPRTLQQFSAHSAALNVSWTVNHDVWVTYASGGQIVARFDPIDLAGVQPKSGEEWLQELPITSPQWAADWMAACLALGEHLSSNRLDANWLRAGHRAIVVRRSAVVTSTAVSYLDLEDDELAAAQQDPRIAAAIAEPTKDKLPLITELIARIAVSSANLPGRPLLDRAFKLIMASPDNRNDSAEVCSQLRVWSNDLTNQANEAFASSGETGHVLPGHGTAHGRLKLQAAAVETLIRALTDDDPAYVAYKTASQAYATHPNTANGDAGRLRALLLVAHHIYDQG
ncbi:hypothetical protein Ppa06_41970 [Planomonospora parontospora subsp. parontospora]|uniref:Uncharacterized protein n=2 Tax=Planomonospora parontospora TaxID=58119 RepID=A0AA37BIZ1_9ACTN|nr:DUF6461 domain-containing protein [Planomonospora parontospora]GGK77854.1 hypothetical protein GCM10010126_41540 [Planomonospora parontospora]GII10399.1 hypothetical protein Ppa06_41970 [Planomonospora parontospora subsp. parontospora]